jgi:hypothetical protein
MSFNNLPFELQAKILRSHPSLKTASLYVSKLIYKESIYHMFIDEGQKLITKSEVLNYINKYNPSQVCRFYFDKEDAWWIYTAVITHMHMCSRDRWDSDVVYQILVDTNIFINYHPNKNHYGDIIIGVENQSETRALLSSMTKHNRENPFEYDLMTTYYCLSERLSCVGVNSNYAKNKILEMFDETTRICDYEDLLIYLRGNAQIMGIYVKGFNKTYINTYKNGFVLDEMIIEKIRTEVELLEKLILKRLESL